jgi:hypothetical protein
LNVILVLILIVGAMLGVIWWQARPSDEDRFIQTAGTTQLTDYLRKRGQLSAR